VVKQLQNLNINYKTGTNHPESQTLVVYCDIRGQTTVPQLWIKTGLV